LVTLENLSKGFPDNIRRMGIVESGG